ncbi:MAG: hypothetical protein IBX36_05790 [Dehalococcoidia bacterium]|nr:hypothetical protein [Dehalococcoidia bacterium]
MTQEGPVVKPHYLMPGSLILSDEGSMLCPSLEVIDFLCPFEEGLFQQKLSMRAAPLA